MYPHPPGDITAVPELKTSTLVSDRDLAKAVVYQRAHPN